MKHPKSARLSRERCYTFGLHPSPVAPANFTMCQAAHTARWARWPDNTSAFFITFCVAAKGCRQQLWYRDIPAHRDFKNGKWARRTLSPGAKKKVSQGDSGRVGWSFTCSHGRGLLANFS